MDRRGGFLALIGGAAFVLVCILTWTGGWPVLGDAEWTFYDWHVRASQSRKPLTLKDTPITLVGMEDDTPLVLWNEARIEDPFYPLPRESYRQAVEQLTKAGAKVIAFDLLLSEAREGDMSLLEALGAHGNVLAATRPIVEEEGKKETFLPISPSLALGLFPGSVEVIRSAGRSVRFVRGLVQDGAALDQSIPHLGIALVAAYRGERREPPVLGAGQLRWGTLRLPLFEGASDPSHVLIRYTATEKQFPYLRYEDLVLGKVPADQLKGRIVLVGRFSALDDRHMTPLGEMPGMVILANLAQMACLGDTIRTTEAASPWIGLVMAGIFLVFVWRLTLLPALFVAVGIVLCWIATAHGAFIRYGIWWETIPPLAVLLLAVVLAIPYEIFRTRRAFETLLSSSAAQSALSGRGMKLGTREVFVTVVFCDIRAFTEYCEMHSAEEVETMLRVYFEAGDTTARRFGSELDKFMGDAIMLYFFEIPGKATGAIRAVQWAEIMLQETSKLGIRVGIGIASGMAREGFIGAPGRMQRTVIGTVVNLASRLQEATKTVGTPLLLSEESFSQLGDTIEAEPLGEITVRGKQMPVAVYRPLFK